MVKLIVHVGHGKTGSTSIQHSLLNAKAELETQKIHYLGLVLEHARTGKPKNWQRAGGSDLFFDQIPVETAQVELAEVLEAELALMEAEDRNLAIWSNEWILERPAKILPVLSNLAAKGFDIEIQLYLRRHDKWAVSAYTQWGLRHKTYPGPVVPFAEWARRRGVAFARYHHLIAPWIEAFPRKVRIMNFDAAGDVTEHFLRINGITGIEVLTDNVSPPDTTLISHVVYNSAKADKVRPNEFERLLKLTDQWDETGKQVPSLDLLMPDAEFMAGFVAERNEDVEKINALLVQAGEPPFSFDKPPRTFSHPSPWEMDQFLLRMIFSMSAEMAQMRGQITALQNATGTARPNTNTK